MYCVGLLFCSVLSIIVTFCYKFQTVITPQPSKIGTHVCMKFFDHKDLGNHLLQLCPKVVKHPVSRFLGKVCSSVVIRGKNIFFFAKTTWLHLCSSSVIYI